MALQTAADIPVRITSPNTSSERRVSPAWTVEQFKARLESITGIPATSQRLVYRGTNLKPGSTDGIIEAADESKSLLSDWRLIPYAEIQVQDTRPAAVQHAANLTDPTASNVPKYEMPPEMYETLPSTVLAYKKANKLGRFAPDAASEAEATAAENAADESLVREKNIALGARCRLLPVTDARRGKVAYVGEIELEDIPVPTNRAGRMWVGVELDEPTGKNNGGIRRDGRRYFECEMKFGVFVRPERVEAGDFPPLGMDDEEELDSDMEEI